MNAAVATPVASSAIATSGDVVSVALPPIPATEPSSIAYTYKRFPVTLVRGEGVTLFDDAGNAYLDCMSGIATNALGYNDAGINAAIAEAVSTGLIHLSNLFEKLSVKNRAQAIAFFYANRASRGEM